MRAILTFALVLAGCSCSDDPDVPPGDAGRDGDGAGPDRVDAPGRDGGDGDTDASGDAMRDSDSGSDASDAGEDAGPTCATGYTFCGGRCIFTAADPDNCGACERACDVGEACVASGCTSSCPSPLTLCGDRCVDLRSDNAHCGACDDPCEMGTGCSDERCVDTVPLDPGPTDCVGGDPLVIVTPEGDRCTGSIATISFTHALCSCHDVGNLSAPALFDAFDSATGSYMPDGRGGSVGADGTIRSSSTFRATGDVRVSGPDGFTAGSGRYTINQSLHVDGAFSGNNTTVDRDGYIGGAIADRATTFGGVLHTPVCADVPMSVMPMSCVDEPVDVPPPCACETSDILSIGAIVDYYTDPLHNDDMVIGLEPDVLAPPGGPIRLDLPCGRYYLTEINASSDVTIAAHGQTALFIGGDIDVSAALLFAVDPGASLDVFVGGTLHDSGSFAVGSPAYPSATRFYVDGPCHHEGASCGADEECCGESCGDDGTCGPDLRAPMDAVRISVRSDLNGLFYAANGPVDISAPLEMYGAIFAYQYEASSDTTIHYDLAAVRLGEACPPRVPEPPDDGGVPDGGSPDAAPDAGPMPECATCRDCDNQACNDGVCGDCTTDADCCSPLYCIAGRCIAAPF